MTRLLSRTVAVAATLALLFAPACGGSEIPPAAEDKVTAQRIVLTSADLPGFTREPEDQDDSGPDPIDQCVDNNPLLSADEKPRGAAGADFSKDDGNLRVQSGALFAEEVAEARKAFADFEGALSSQCLKDGLKQAIEEGADPGLVVRDVSSAPLPDLELADESAGARLTVPLEADGERLSVHVDMTVLRVGRAVAGVFTFQAGSPFPDPERIRLARLVADRMSGKAKNTPDTGPAATTATTAVSSPRTTGTATGTYTRFRDPSGVSLEHPSTWTVEPSGASSPLIVFIDPPTGVSSRRNVNILVQSPLGGMTLDEYTQLSIKQINDIPGTTVGESRPTTLSGSPAYRHAYRGDLGSGDLRFLAVWTIRSGKAWVVTYVSDPARYNPGLPEIERLLTTIQLPA